ncbi:glutathione peroxidase [Marinagarivorans algicola]|uniref:glutathione peroxidase n=1 Tax=Marinagarivorans algicola TaxID=1513270 RepID=UPI0006B9AEEE|nr:glutathione peroxidase [Marinagarivorans algicola]
MTQSIYDYTVNQLDGSPLPLANLKDKVILVVNTASKCGFTPQYEGLESLHQQYHEKGLEILGFPCNQFGKQEPGSTTEIGAFCQKNYGVSFTMCEKIDVNGAKASPVYQYLKTAKPGLLGSKNIKWNFTKFLINRSGTVLKRYGSATKPADIADDIERALSST